MNNDKKNKEEEYSMTVGFAIFAIATVTPWVFGIALAIGWLNTLVSIIFPPYAWILTAKWIISLVS